MIQSETRFTLGWIQALLISCYKQCLVITSNRRVEILFAQITLSLLIFLEVGSKPICWNVLKWHVVLTSPKGPWPSWLHLTGSLGGRRQTIHTRRLLSTCIWYHLTMIDQGQSFNLFPSSSLDRVMPVHFCSWPPAIPLHPSIILLVSIISRGKNVLHPIAQCTIG